MNLPSTSNLRLGDVFIIGPITMMFSKYIKLDWLKSLVWLAGLLTVVYNLINFLKFTVGIPHNKMVPNPIRDLLYHPKHGKTQLQRLINLIIMYPLFWYSLSHLKSIPPSKMYIKWLFQFFLYIGFVYNLNNYIAIQHKFK